MSKAALKKELATFTNEQLVEVVLAAYDSSKETKEYFEFFLNPDAEALMQKRLQSIRKEICRGSSYWKNKARISVIRAEIKSLHRFGLGVRYTSELIFETLRIFLQESRNYAFSRTIYNGIIKLIYDFLCQRQENESLSDAITQLEALYSDENIGTLSMRNFYKFNTSQCLKALSENIKI